MSLEHLQTENVCPREEISIYLDGELSFENGALLEKHFEDCKTCRDESNLQKQMLTALSFAFEKRNEIDLPKDFTKMVVTRAESGVKGLRCRNERLKAMMLILSLFMLLVFGFGAESENIFSAANTFGNQTAAVVSFFGHLAYDFAFGIGVIVRSLSQKIASSLIFLIFGATVAGFLFVARRLSARLSRGKVS